MTPLRYYMRLRVERARELLLYSDRPIIEVAVSGGLCVDVPFRQLVQAHLWAAAIGRARQPLAPADLRASAQAPS